MKRIILILIIISFLSAISIPGLVEASLVPCGKSGQSACTLCDFIVGIHDLINYGLKILIIIAIVAIFISGIIYIISIGEPKMMEQAKSFIKAAVLGCVFVLGAWLFVNITMRVLSAQTNLGISEVSSWSTFSCSPSSNTTTTTSN